MYDLYMTVRSVTPAQRGRAVLEQAGLRCVLLRAPREIAPGGCAYALALHSGQAERARALLRRAGVSWEGVWLQSREGFERLER